MVDSRHFLYSLYVDRFEEGRCRWHSPRVQQAPIRPHTHAFAILRARVLASCSEVGRVSSIDHSAHHVCGCGGRRVGHGVLQARLEGDCRAPAAAPLYRRKRPSPPPPRRGDRAPPARPLQAWSPGALEAAPEKTARHRGRNRRAKERFLRPITIFAFCR